MPHKLIPDRFSQVGKNIDKEANIEEKMQYMVEINSTLN